MTMQTTVTLSEKQVQVVKEALDLYVRIGLGQFEAAVDVASKMYPQTFVWEDRDYILPLKQKMGFNSNSSYGVGNPNLTKKTREAFLVYQVLTDRSCILNYTVDSKTPEVSFEAE